MQLRFFILIVNLFSYGFICAQNGYQTRMLGEAAYKNKSFDLAIESFNRYIYFYPDSISPLIYYKVGSCYEAQRQFNTARNYYSLSYNLTDDRSVKTDILLSQARCAVLNKEFNLALSDLLAIDSTYSKDQEYLLNFLSGTCYFANAQVKSASKSFYGCVTNTSDSILLSEVLYKWERFEQKSGSKAKWMSVFLPGLGQAYSGSYRSSLNSLMLTGSLGILYTHVTLTYGLVDGIMAVLPWFMRYYKGGYTKAPILLEQRKAERRDKRYNEILSVISR
jgi:tetratricopeptide (TPR) repeat protein